MEEHAHINGKFYWRKPSETPKIKPHNYTSDEINKLVSDLIHWGETVTWGGFDFRPKPIIELNKTD